MNYLQKCFAVTVSKSLYQIECPPPGQKTPFFTKIASLDKFSNVPAGRVLGNGAKMISIGRKITAFNPKSGERQMLEFPDDKGQVRIGYYGSQTSAVVALFLNESDARSCLAARSTKRLDERWLTHTRATLAQIGDSHPYFSVATLPKYSLLQL